MKTKSIFKILNLKKGEGNLILLPIIYSFFTGTALAFFVTSATSLFLSSFERDMLPLAFIAAGILVWLSGLLYSYFQKKTKYTKILTGGLLLLLVSVITFLSFYISTKSIIAIFLLYAWIRVFAYIHAITFWGLAGRIFSLRQGKRVFGLITGGEVFASIISFFSVPFLLKVIDTEDLLFISGAALIAGFFVLILIVRKFKENLDVKKTEKPEKKIQADKTKHTFLKNRYFKLFYIIAFLPIFAQFFVDFIFQSQAKIEFPIRETLTSFVGVFFGISAIVEFILKTFVSGRLMNRYGVRFGLLAFPVMLAFSFILASVFGLFYGAVSLFFSFVSLGRLFTRAVRTSFNDPATQILYQPLPPEERLSFQNKIESGPKAFASITAGVLLFIFTKVSFFTLVYFSIFLLIVIILWYKTAILVFKEYKQVLLSALSKKIKTKTVSPNQKIFEYLQSSIETINNKTKGVIKYMSKSVFPYREKILFSKENEIQPTYKLKELINLANSNDFNDREIAAKNLGNYDIYKIEVFIIKLLTDNDYNVRAQAILTAGKLKEPELFKFLFANLRIEDYHDIVFSAILHIGEKILPDLDKFFYTIEHIQETQISVIKLMEIIGGKQAKKMLQTKIGYNNKAVNIQVIKALSKLSYKAKRSNIAELSLKLKEEVNNFVYIIASLSDIKKYFSNDDDIIRSLNHEKKSKNEQIFIILSILYDPNAIKLIKINLESNEADSIGFALEIAEIIISDIHKEILAPIFEDLSDKDLVSKYHYQYPQEKISIKDRLLDIINSESSVTVDFTKALAISLLSNYDFEDVISVLKANIIHPNIIIRETAAIILFGMKPKVFEEQAILFKSKIKGFNDLFKKITLKTNNENLLILEKLRLLRSLDIFSNLTYGELSKFAINAVEYHIKDGESLICDTENRNTIYLCIFGQLTDINTNTTLNEGDIISLYNKDAKCKQIKIIANEPTFMLKGKIHLLNKLFAENIEFAKKLTKNIIHS